MNSVTGTVNLIACFGGSPSRRSAECRRCAAHRPPDPFAQSISTTDYGIRLLGRFTVKAPLFLQAEYEYLDYEFIRPDRSTDRATYDSVFAGAGIAQPVGKNAQFWVTALYNLTYDSGDIRNPYDTPWVFRAGIGFSF